MAHTPHRIGTVSLLYSATESIELAAGGGLGCPDGGARNDEHDEPT